MDKLWEWCKNRSTLNIIIDSLLFLLLAMMAGIGFLIRYVLVAGYVKNQDIGINYEYLFWGLDRHEWGYIHLVVSILFLFFIILHLCLHWKIIVCSVKKMVSSFSTVFLWTILILGLVFMVAPFLIEPEVQLNEPLNRNRQTSPSEMMLYVSDSVEVVQNDSSMNDESKEIREHHQPDAELHKGRRNDDSHQRIVIDQRSTLAELAQLYDIPVQHLCKELNVKENQKNIPLIQLKRKYKFALSDVKKVIRDYKPVKK